MTVVESLIPDQHCHNEAVVDHTNTFHQTPNLTDIRLVH